MPAYLGNNDRKFFYVDNLSTIPYYKVTYYSKDGTTVLAEKYVDPAESTYTVEASLLPEDATGFAEAMGGDAVTSVSLAYKDVSLYAGQRGKDHLYRRNEHLHDHGGRRFCFPDNTSVRI